MTVRTRIVLVGGDGGRSGVPRHISHLYDVLKMRADVTVISDVDRGGYGFAAQHVQVPGLATSINPLAAIGALRGLSAALTRIKPDLVWAHARMSVPLCRLALRAQGAGRLMVTYHGAPYGPGHGAVKSLVSKLIDTTSLYVSPRHDVVFLTDEDRQSMAGAVRGQQSHVLPNCSWLGGFAAPQGERSGPRQLVMLTRDSGQKNLDRAARVFAALPPDFCLNLYGMGTDAPALRQRFGRIIGNAALARVRFCGDTADVRDALSQADGVLVTSRYEGLSISMIEAMEMGLPVFSTPVGGTALIAGLHPLFGEITEDLTQTATTIDRITATFRSDPVKYAGRTHDAWARQFSPGAWAVKVNALVDLILGGRP